MKAVDLFNKYEPRFFPAMRKDDDGIYRPTIGTPTKDQIQETVLDIVCEFAKEVADIAKTRNVKALRVNDAIIKEQNDKWNAVCRLFEKKYGKGRSPLKHNGFLLVWKISNNIH